MTTFSGFSQAPPGMDEDEYLEKLDDLERNRRDGYTVIPPVSRSNSNVVPFTGKSHRLGDSSSSATTTAATANTPRIVVQPTTASKISKGFDEAVFPITTSGESSVFVKKINSDDDGSIPSPPADDSDEEQEQTQPPPQPRLFVAPPPPPPPVDSTKDVVVVVHEDSNSIDLDIKKSKDESDPATRLSSSQQLENVVIDLAVPYNRGNTEAISRGEAMAEHEAAMKYWEDIASMPEIKAGQPKNFNAYYGADPTSIAEQKQFWLEHSERPNMEQLNQAKDENFAVERVSEKGKLKDHAALMAVRHLVDYSALQRNKANATFQENYEKAKKREKEFKEQKKSGVPPVNAANYPPDDISPEEMQRQIAALVPKKPIDSDVESSDEETSDEETGDEETGDVEMKVSAAATTKKAKKRLRSSSDSEEDIDSGSSDSDSNSDSDFEEKDDVVVIDGSDDNGDDSDVVVTSSKKPKKKKQKTEKKHKHKHRKHKHKHSKHGKGFFASVPLQQYKDNDEIVYLYPVNDNDTGEKMEGYELVEMIETDSSDEGENFELDQVPYYKLL